MTVTKFVVRHGRIVTAEPLVLETFGEELLETARTALGALRAGSRTVPLSLKGAAPAVVGLGLPSIDFPMPRLSEAEREQWEAGREAREQAEQRAGFYLSQPPATEFYRLVPAGIPTAERNSASLYGLIAGTYAHVEVRLPASERDPRPQEERSQQFQAVAAQMVAAAPSFMCTGWLNGAVADFGDCFAAVMLSIPVDTTA